MASTVLQFYNPYLGSTMSKNIVNGGNVGDTCGLLVGMKEEKSRWTEQECERPSVDRMDICDYSANRGMCV